MASEHAASAAGSSDASQQHQRPQQQQPQQQDDNNELFAAKLLRGEFPKNITLKHASAGTEFKSDGILKAIDSTRMGCWVSFEWNVYSLRNCLTAESSMIALTLPLL
jgi:hypothetical protein